MGADAAQVTADAERFETFIEDPAAETGAWRGTVGPQTQAGREGAGPM